MASIRFYIVDVFAVGKYTGNQLAVFRNARSISESDMQSIAKEMNYSETTFILSDRKRNGGYDVRIFTPEEELPFAGHPTLGTAHVIMREIIGKRANVVLNLSREDPGLGRARRQRALDAVDETEATCLRKNSRCRADLPRPGDRRP